MDQLPYHDILYNDAPIGPYPSHLLKRVPEPTNKVPGPVERKDQRSSVFARSLLGEFGEELEREFKRMTVRYPVGGALVDLQNHINLYPRRANPVAKKKAPIPTDPRVLSRHLKCLGHFLGADIVGIGPLPQSAVYSHDMKGREIDAPYPWAIALVVRKHEPTLCASNGWEEIVDGASFQAYQRVALQTEAMANYIRRLGWNAVATNMNSYVTLMPQIALDCGIGEVSRMGIVLNPFLGANFKVAAVLTDMELEADGYADFGLQDYCASCTDLRRPVPLARHHARQADALQRLLHLEAQRPRVQRLRHPEQGRVRVRAVHQGLPVAPPAHGRRATSRRGTATSAGCTRPWTSSARATRRTGTSTPASAPTSGGSRSTRSTASWSCPPGATRRRSAGSTRCSGRPARRRAAGALSARTWRSARGRRR